MNDCELPSSSGVPLVCAVRMTGGARCAQWCGARACVLGQIHEVRVLTTPLTEKEPKVSRTRRKTPWPNELPRDAVGMARAARHRRLTRDQLIEAVQLLADRVETLERAQHSTTGWFRRQAERAVAAALGRSIAR